MFVKNGLDITVCCNPEAGPSGLGQPELFRFSEPCTGAGCWGKMVLAEAFFSRLAPGWHEGACRREDIVILGRLSSWVLLPL